MQSIGLDEYLVDQAMEDAGMLVVQIERLLRILSETIYQVYALLIVFSISCTHEPAKICPSVVSSTL